MRRFIPTLTTVLFSAVAFSVYAIDEPTDPNPPPPQEKLAKKKSEQQPGNPADQPAARQPSGAGDERENSHAPGRGDPTGATMTPTPAPTDPYKQ